MVTQGYGHDESAPTPDGMFATNFVGVRNVIAIRLQHFGNPLAAVGDRFIAPAYTYSPTKWQTDMCVRWCGNVYLIMWKHVIDNVDMCVRWNGNTYLIMWIYVFDNVDMRVRWICPYAWRNVRCAFHGLFVGILRNVRWTFRWCSQRYRNPFAAVGVRFIVPAYTYSQRIRNPFRIHSRNVRHAFRGRTLHY